ncbi:MAG: hypothetical protein ACT4OU_10730 [Hyphomicrobium sp.]
MKHLSIGALAVCAIALGSPLTAHADGRYDVEHARANARAGGPVSEYDYELLERWGHLSEIQHPRAVDGRRVYKKKRRYVDDRRW